MDATDEPVVQAAGLRENVWVPITLSQSLSWCLLLEEGSSSEVSGCERRISRRVVRVVFRGLPGTQSGRA
jgi:hypothetical protein